MDNAWEGGADQATTLSASELGESRETGSKEDGEMLSRDTWNLWKELIIYVYQPCIDLWARVGLDSETEPNMFVFETS